MSRPPADLVKKLSSPLSCPFAEDGRDCEEDEQRARTLAAADAHGAILSVRR